MFDSYLEPKATGYILLMAAFILIPATYQASIYSVNKKKKITPIILFIEMKECLCFKLIQATLLEVIGKASTWPKTHISAPKLSRPWLC